MLVALDLETRLALVRQREVAGAVMRERLTEIFTATRRCSRAHRRGLRGLRAM
ncbi:MAG TPA: hypothetical protein VFT22_13365 [Kofleriaceae bacterium]|nr:hypothetical protein [Kofleriaceae bacterium]